MIYFQIEKRGSITREEIPERLQDFVRTLREMFGSSGFVIERLIARQFYKKLELTFDNTRDYGLIRYVEEARRAVRAGRS